MKADTSLAKLNIFWEPRLFQIYRVFITWSANNRLPAYYYNTNGFLSNSLKIAGNLQYLHTCCNCISLVLLLKLNIELWPCELVKAVTRGYKPWWPGSVTRTTPRVTESLWGSQAWRCSGRVKRQTSATQTQQQGVHVVTTTTASVYPVLVRTGRVCEPLGDRQTDRQTDGGVSLHTRRPVYNTDTEVKSSSACVCIGLSIWIISAPLPRYNLLHLLRSPVSLLALKHSLLLALGGT